MSLGTSIQISGSGFDADPANNTVMIGGVSCTVTASTSSTIDCTIGVGPLGAHKVMVTVAGKGYAEHSSGNVTFSYDADVTSIDPSSGSQGGIHTCNLSLINTGALLENLLYAYGNRNNSG